MAGGCVDGARAGGISRARYPKGADISARVLRDRHLEAPLTGGTRLELPAPNRDRAHEIGLARALERSPIAQGRGVGPSGGPKQRDRRAKRPEKEGIARGHTG